MATKKQQPPNNLFCQGLIQGVSFSPLQSALFCDYHGDTANKFPGWKFSNQREQDWPYTEMDLLLLLK